MKPYQLLSVGPDEPSPTRPRPVGLPRTRGGLSLLLLAFCLATAFLSPAFAADGALDPSFITGPGPFAGVQTIPGIRGQAYYITGGDFNGYSLIFGKFPGLGFSGTPPFYRYNCIVRLTDTGVLDASFINDQVFGEIRSVYIYPHDDPNFADKILIGGDFSAYSGTKTYKRFARLNADGSLDIEFPQTFGGEGEVNSIAVQGSGTSANILVGGYFMDVSDVDHSPLYHLVRLNYNGTLDGSFTPWGAPGGYISNIKILPHSDPTYPDCVRIFCSYPKNPDGSGGTYYLLLLDAALNLSSPVASIGDETVDGPIFNWARQSDGMALIGGDFQHVNNIPRNRVARLYPNLRTLDTGYNVGVGPNSAVTQISPMSSTDDRMVLAGNFSTWNGAPRGHLVRLDTSGNLDTSFTSATGADDLIMHMDWIPGRGGLIYGYFRSYNGQPRGGIALLNANGVLDGAYANVIANQGFPFMVFSLATQKDGKIIVGGSFTGVGGKYRGGLARINPNGSLDTSFQAAVDGWVQSVAVQADGKILVAGCFARCQGYVRTSLARLNPDGSLDTAFNPRLGAGYNPSFTVNQVVPLSNGQIMMAGDIKSTTYRQIPAVRLNSDGTLDDSFNASSFDITGAIWWCARRLAVVGSNYVIAGNYDTAPDGGGGYLARLTQSGGVDPSFGSGNNHMQTTDGGIEDMFLQPDGKIVVSGEFTHVLDGSGSGTARLAIARFSADGWLDNTFIPSLPPPTGADTIIAAMAGQPNGKILIEANFFNNDNFVSTQVARLNSNGSPDPSFIQGNPANGGYWSGNSILRLPSGKALIGGNFSSYNGAAAWSLVRIFAGPANFSPGALYLLLEN